MNRLSFKKKVDIFPSLLIIVLVSHFVYYYNFIIGEYTSGGYLIVLAMIIFIVSYIFGKTIRIKSEDKSLNNPKLFYRYANIALLIGVIAHVVFYGRNLSQVLSGYGESYLASRGNGFIIVFFDFMILAFGMYEILIKRGDLKKSRVYFIRLIEIIYAFLYVVILLKRRQIIMLLLIISAVRYKGISQSKKIVMYGAIFVTFIVFMIYGKARGYLDIYGFNGVFEYISANFELSWLSLAGSEGQYISRTHSQVVEYVRMNGNVPSILMGILLIIVPRRILPFNKPLAFPEWNTSTFHPELYQRGVGLAGSFVAENYLIMGVTLIIITYTFLGLYLSNVQRKRKNSSNDLNNLFYGWVVYIVVLLPRLDFASIFMMFIFWVLPLRYIERKVTK